MLVKGVTQDVIDIIKQDKDIQAGNRKAIALVEEKVLPHFNFTAHDGARGGANWRKATPEQQKHSSNSSVRCSCAPTRPRCRLPQPEIDFKPLRAKPPTPT